MPRSVRLLEQLDFDPPGPAKVLRAWRASPGGRSTRAVIGVSGSGPFAVDLRGDGPHGLVAGTTGAGKSELLQSLVASLAVGNRPDALNFVLVDYKGGSAFKECRLLPHCVGIVTDLDGHLAARALASLTAELKRRETLLGAVGAKDVEEYWSLTDGQGQEPLPRLLIVVDEFATLVEEVPEFVGGVVGIGMRGRSLGVHVLLATQRPGGAVSADMRANLNLRICLRVANDGESADVIEVPDAARIGRDTPGRACARTGYNDLTLFQAARVGVARPGAEEGAGPKATRSAPAVAPLSVPAMGTRPPDAEGDDEAGSGATDLTLLVAAVNQAAGELAAGPGRSPWLPPLAEVVPVESITGGGGVGAVGSLEAVIGLVDVPEAQAQEPFVLDLVRAGSVLIGGAVRSGRSTALRTIAAGLCRSVDPAELHLYAIDCGNRALEPLAAFPHCGAVVAADDADRVTRLIEMLGALVQGRARSGSVDPGPAVVVLVDRLEAFVARYGERDGGRLADGLDRLLREGRAVGMHFVLSGDRTAFTSRLASAVEARLVLRQADRNDYSLFGLDARAVPAHMPNGRAIWAPAGHEVQIAVLGPDGTEERQVSALGTLAAELAQRWPLGADGAPAGRAARAGQRGRPRRVDPLPEATKLSDLVAAGTGYEVSVAGDAVVTVGAGGDELGPVQVDLQDAGPGFVVAGPARAGRSTALVTMVRSMTGRERKERAVILVTPRVSPLRALAGLPGVVASLAGGPDLGGDLQRAVDELDGPAALVIDDGELVADAAGRVLEGLLRTAHDERLVVLAAATTDDLLVSRYRGWLADARRSRSGLLLTPAASIDGEVFDLRLPRSTSGGWPPGRGLLVVRGQMEPIQVALPG